MSNLDKKQEIDNYHFQINFVTHLSQKNYVPFIHEFHIIDATKT